MLCSLCSKRNLSALSTIIKLKRHLSFSQQFQLRRRHPGINSIIENEDFSNPKTNTPIRNLLQESSSIKQEPDLYPHKGSKERHQGKNFISPLNRTLKTSSIIVFPGQGTQFVGMAKDLVDIPNVKHMYEAASEILGYDLMKLSCEGPENELRQTKYQQPAVFVASLASLEKLRLESPGVLNSCVATAGFSIGEITALTFADVFTFENAVRLVQMRAEAMQLASDMNPSGMMTVFFGPDSKLGFACSVAKEYCEKIGIEEADCRVANFLYPHCKVVAGNTEALEFIIKNKDDFKLKRIKKLNVSGAFHTNLMKPAYQVFKEAIEDIAIKHPRIPVYSNVDGKAYKHCSHIRNQLPKQIYKPVRWEQTLHTFYENTEDGTFPSTYECGPGKSLKAILKMVNAKAWEKCYNVEA